MKYEIDINEVLRYLGCKERDDETVSAIEKCSQEIYSSSAVRFVYRYAALNGTKTLFDGGFELMGDDIACHLDGCKKCVLMAATLGSGVETLIRSAQVSDMARAVILDSCATAAIENVCDKIQFDIIAGENPELFMTSRFSPGYGDMPLECQKTFLKVLDAERKIGLTATHSDILLPKKSVTAIIGFSENQIKSNAGCASCNMNGRCAYQGFGGCKK